jgi:hypothetical protein
VAAIKTQGMGKAAVVLLDESDRSFLYSALQAYASSSGLSITAIAKKLGVNRTYLYTLLDSNQIELSRLASIQDLVGCYLISDAAVLQYSSSTQLLISGRPFGFQWLDFCPQVRISAFYVQMFLLPAMKREVNVWQRIYSLAAGPETVLPEFAEDGFLVELIATYCSAATSLFEDAIHDNFYEHSADSLGLLDMSMPIAMPSSSWPDILDSALDQIYDYCKPSEDISQESFDARYPPGIDATADDQLLEQMQCDRDFLRLEEAHSIAEHRIMKVVGDIDSWYDTLAAYCHETNRLPRRPFYFPLELEQVIADLASNTIPVLNSGLASD